VPTVSSTVGENHVKHKLTAGELVLCMGVNQMRTPNIVTIAGACGFNAIEAAARRAALLGSDDP
jgi:hypothetical protein